MLGLFAICMRMGILLFYILVYAHIFRGLYYGSYMEPRQHLKEFRITVAKPQAAAIQQEQPATSLVYHTSTRTGVQYLIDSPAVRPLPVSTGMACPSRFVLVLTERRGADVKIDPALAACGDLFSTRILPSSPVPEARPQASNRHPPRPEPSPSTP